MDRANLVNEFIEDIKPINTERPKKERFISLLKDMFYDNEEAHKFINEFTTGAEKTVFKIPIKNRVKTGYVDTQFRKIIIEFESDLNKKGYEAREQLKEYVAGLWQEEENSQFILIASDFITWKIYAPKYDHIIGQSFISDDVELIENEVFNLEKHNSEDFYYFLDRYLFKTEPQIPTLDRIKQEFGESSDTFLNVIRELTNYFEKVKDDGHVKVSFEQWNKFLSIAYGDFDASNEIFLVHTYLSIFSKFLAYEVLTQDEYIDEEELKGVITGQIFEKHYVENFIDKDFYNWVAIEPHFSQLKKAFRIISQKIGEYDFTEVNEDILKGVYQELIDLETRHSLGEYYTPDWLCETIVDDLEPEKDAKILDPACGSGSFLRAIVDYKKKKYSNVSASELANNTVGIDIHPLSVQIAKTTLLLSLGNLLKEKRPIFLRIYLANTLLIPEIDSVQTLFGKKTKITINDTTYELDSSVFQDQELYDQALNIAEELANVSNTESPVSRETFANTLKQRNGYCGNADQLNSFYELYKALNTAVNEGRNGIWRFILQNTYKPFLLPNQFNYVIGNPPWLTFSDIKVSSYQEDLKTLAERQQVLPKREANRPHLEIAAIFLSHCSESFLTKDGKIGFVLPRSFFSADHHTNTRSGRSKGFKITGIWDLKDVKPLFNVPSCVIFGKREKVKRDFPKNGVPGYIVKGKLPAHNASKKAFQNLSFNNTRWYRIELGKLDAFSTFKVEKSNKKNFYYKYFRQGATIVPRNCYFIELAQRKPTDNKERSLVVETSRLSIKYSKKPWDEVKLQGKVYSKFLFKTAQSRNVLPFSHVDLPTVILPIDFDANMNPILMKWEKMLELGYLDTANWFRKVEIEWENRKTDRNKSVSYLDYLNWQNKITEQNYFANYNILYTASAKNANATVIKNDELPYKFCVDYKTYYYQTNNLDEAYFISSFLNSNIPNEIMKPFQSTGLLGERDVSKKILEIPFPSFNINNELHFKLAKLGENCHSKANEYAKERNFNSLSPNQLGRARREINEFLQGELTEIDKIVKELIK